MPRSILEIDVKDEKFKAFLSLFKEYQDQLKEMSGFWEESGHAAEATGTATGGMVDALAAGAASTALMVEALGKGADHAIRAESVLRSMAGHATSIAGSILSATLDLAKWGALSIGAGLIGAGGSLYGLDALANAISGQRKQALGLGITTGEQQAFGVNFGSRLVGSDFLSGVQGVRADLAEQWQFGQLGIPSAEVQGADTAQLGIDVIRRAQQLWQQAGPGGHNTQWMQAHGLAGFMDFATWQRIGQSTPGEIEQYAGQYGRDVKSMSIPDPTQRAWQDFVIELDRVKDQLEAVFGKGLMPLVQSDALPHLTSAIEHVIDVLVGKTSSEGWIDKLAHWIDEFSTYLAGDKFEKDLKSVVDGIAYAADRIGDVLRFLGILPGTPSGLEPLPHAPGTEEYSTGHAARLPNGQPIPPPLGAPDTDRQLYERNLQSWRQNQSLSDIERTDQLPVGLLTAVGMQESGLNPNVPDSVVRRVHYQGPFQLSPGFIRAFGITDPSSVAQEAPAAGVILKRYLQQYGGNIAEALAAYDWGPGKLDKDIKAHGKDWLRYAPPETQKYVSDVAGRLHLTVSVINQTGAQVAIAANAVRQ